MKVPTAARMGSRTSGSFWDVPGMPGLLSRRIKIANPDTEHTRSDVGQSDVVESVWPVSVCRGRFPSALF